MLPPTITVPAGLTTLPNGSIPPSIVLPAPSSTSAPSSTMKRSPLVMTLPPESTNCPAWLTEPTIFDPSAVFMVPDTVPKIVKGRGMYVPSLVTMLLPGRILPVLSTTFPKESIPPSTTVFVLSITLAVSRGKVMKPSSMTSPLVSTIFPASLIVA